METVVIIPSKAEVKLTTRQTAEPLPSWLTKMVHRQQSLNKRYERAQGQFASAYNEFLMAIEEINEQHGTNFSFQQAATDYQGLFADGGTMDEDDEDDED